jgi:hypothetical protein
MALTRTTMLRGKIFEKGTVYNGIRIPDSNPGGTVPHTLMLCG